ncbi:hypothetical protein AB0I81_50875 [Nonomuraea sp. NPDC050404]|uniref:hypothetical protein n=1 Tax=Nonomuraea sp. NPDC050404 TaxID=3155783 RepID=UPI0033CB4F22
MWLAAADTEAVATCPAGCCHPASGPLARHLVAACVQPGETVVHLGASDHQLASAALTAGCLPVAVFTDAALAGVSWACLARIHAHHDLEAAELRVTDPDESPALADLAGSAGLVVAEQTCWQPLGRSTGRPNSETGAEVFGVACAAELIQLGGHLVVVTGLHQEERVADPVPEIIALARAAGLVYLRHIITQRHPARGERIGLDLSRRAQAAIEEPPGYAELPPNTRTHSGLVIFTKPRRSAGSPNLRDLRAERELE